MRFKSTKRVLVSVVLLGVAVCFRCGGFGVDLAEAATNPKEPIKIGYINTFTGKYAMHGETGLKAWRLALKERKYQIAGRKVEVVSDDDRMDPKIALMKTRRMVETEGIHFMAGYFSSGVAPAVMSYLKEKKIPMIADIGAGAATLKAKGVWTPYCFWFSSAGASMFSGEPQWLYKQGARKMVTMGYDYSWGRDNAAIVRGWFESVGGKVVKDVFVPFGIADFSAELTSLNPGEVDVIWTSFSGGEVATIVRQFKEFGLHKKGIRISSGTMVMEEMLEAAGPEAAEVGLTGVLPKTTWQDWPLVQHFVESWKRDYGHRPGSIAAFAYDAALGTFKALEAIQGNVEDVKVFCDAMRKLEFDGIAGHQGIEPCTGCVWYPTYAVKVVNKGKGVYGHQILEVADPKAIPSKVLKVMNLEPGGKGIYPCTSK
jgi:branched-chain amino acid transport system substrate-binding protein